MCWRKRWTGEGCGPPRPGRVGDRHFLRYPRKPLPDVSALVNASQQVGGSLRIALFSTIAAAATAGGASLAAVAAGYSMVFLWAAGVAILITPVALLLINIDRRKFTGTGGDAPVVHLG